jgi:N-acetylmuramoyl-L-alanine amidase
MTSLFRVIPVALLLAMPGAAEIRITAVRFWSLGDVTRVAIETNGEAQYHADRLDNPDRVFLDLDDARPQTRGIETIPVGDSLLRQIRIALTQPGVARVVLDLSGPVEYAVSKLRNPDRIMVELRIAGRASATPPVRSITGGRALTESPPEEPEPVREPVVVVSAEKPRRTTLREPEVRPVNSEPIPEPPSMAISRLPDSRPLAESPRASAPAPAAEPARPLAQTESKHTSETALAAKRDSRGNRSLIRALGLKLERVVIDPGHGGHDTGTIGPGGLAEKDLVLDIAKRLGALITERLGAEVVYTRTDDTFVPLETRTELANEKRADLFLSIHANSSRLRGIAGPETFYLNFTTSASALEVAARENASSQKSIYELQSLIQKIALKEKIQESREFASTVQKALYSGLVGKRSVKNRGVKQAPFIVLIGAQMPSVLAEIAFLSNPREEALLKRGNYRQKIAEALYKGVSRYADTLSHFQVAQGKSGATP